MTAARHPWPPPGYRPPRRYGQLRDEVQAGTRFQIDGEGPAVVLIHGVGLDLAMWDPLVAALQGDYSLVRYDFWGHGGSHKPLSPLRLKDYVDQLDDLLAYLKIERCVLVGFSMGAMIARGFSLRATGKLAGLCLMNAVHERSEQERAAVAARLNRAEEEGPGVIVEAALERWFTPAFRQQAPAVVDGVRDRLQRNDRRGFLTAYRVFAEADRTLAEMPGRADCPALVMTGALDRGSTPAMAESLAAELEGEAAVLEGLAHLAPLEDAPRVAARLREFLERRCG